MYLQKLYEKYCKEESGKNGTALLTVEAFQELIEPRLARCKKVEINDGENGEGVLYYCLWEEDGLQFCATPVFGYYASSEKALSKLFMQQADDGSNCAAFEGSAGILSRRGIYGRGIPGVFHGCRYGITCCI